MVNNPGKWSRIKERIRIATEIWMIDPPENVPPLQIIHENAFITFGDILFTRSDYTRRQKDTLTDPSP